MATELGAADEVFHPAGDDPNWNESGWFGFSIPERDINGFVQPGRMRGTATLDGERPVGDRVAPITLACNHRRRK